MPYSESTLKHTATDIYGGAVEDIQEQPFEDTVNSSAGSEETHEPNLYDLNSAQQEYLSQVADAIHEANDIAKQRVKKSIAEVSQQAADLEFALANAKRGRRELHAELARIESEAANLDNTLAQLSESMCTVSTQIKELGAAELLAEAQEVELELRTYLKSLGIEDSDDMINRRHSLEDRKQYLVEENESIRSDIQTTTNDIFRLKERGIQNRETLTEANKYAIGFATTELNIQLSDLNQQLVLNESRIEAYDLYDEKLQRLHAIDERTDALRNRYDALNAQLADLYRQISELTGAPEFQEYAIPEEPESNIEEVKETTTDEIPSESRYPDAETYTHQPRRPQIPGVAIFHTRYQQV